jgi:hypothetical protein
MPNKSHFLEPKLALAKLGIETMITELLKNNANMLGMLFLGLGEDKNVIDENHHKDIKLFKKK